MGAAHLASVSIAVLLGGAAVVGCGPSFQAVYEGNARFEHCYALEENPQAAARDKASCWRTWSEHYTYGQTRDRIHYATARYVALTAATDIPTDEALMMGAPGETPRKTTITAPTPTNAFAPPPKVLEQNEQTASGTGRLGDVPMLNVDAGAPAVPTAVSLPASTCADGCSGNYRGCNVACDGPADGGAAKSKACTACTKTYRTCMRDCFK